MNEEGINVSNLVAYDEKPDDGKEGNTERWMNAAPEVVDIIEVLSGSFTAEPGANPFNATSGMKLVGSTQELLIKGTTSMKI